jgi:hypothetical protein
MVKYISNLVIILKGKISGMKDNAEKWQSLPVTIVEMEGYVKKLEEAEARIDTAANELRQARAAGRNLAAEINLKAGQVDSLAEGIHALELVKLSEYGIGTRKGKSSKPVPGKAIISSIADEFNGAGFIVTFIKLAHADHYEVERGVAPNADDKVLETPFPFLKSTTKTIVNDDDVEKGKRYFYRVRGVNAAGHGAWSEPVSRVQ